VLSTFALHPLVRVRAVNVILQGTFDSRSFHDDRQGLGTLSDRGIKAGSLALLGDWRDGFLGGGTNNFSIGFTRGDVDIETASDRAADEAGRHTHGSYGKLNGSIVRSQNIAERTTVYVSYAFQLASKNLDGSEKVSLGGPGSVRAYAVGEGTSDEAQLMSAELRHGLPSFGIPGALVGSVFYDLGHGTFNRKPMADELNRRTLQGAGVGVSWLAQNNFLVRTSVAWRLSGAPTADPVDRKPRLYFQLVKNL
jgi:hemolysin activation/secretion protein